MSKRFPLIVEPHPQNYDGYEFITLVKYNDESFLTIVDNVTKKYIVSYILDFCGPEKIDEQRLIEVAHDWYYQNGDRYPISIEFSKMGISKHVYPLLRSFPVDYVTRVIGPLPNFEMNGPYKVRKRKRKQVPKNIEIVDKTKFSQNHETD